MHMSHPLPLPSLDQLYRELERRQHRNKILLRVVGITTVIVFWALLIVPMIK